ncbi:unnamed protein product [Mytilus coruscus]|uniref:Uncharacterized protein n=1 Tax=Mytilus coruscus TaxID=42192 RepID=A0A6J7ZXJ3_MYTCO|nr:unnamed protein product [Mytilus coruscus]
MQRFFETISKHLMRGPQDAAGGFLKKQADLAVIRGTHVIQSSSDLFDYAQSNLSTTADSSKCSRRIFRYVDCVNRDRDRNFLPVKENRKIHQVRSFDDGEIFVRKLSCYSCQSCIVGNYSTCTNDAQLGTYNKIKMVKESEHNDSDAIPITTNGLMTRLTFVTLFQKEQFLQLRLMTLIVHIIF